MTIELDATVVEAMAQQVNQRVAADRRLQDLENELRTTRRVIEQQVIALRLKYQEEFELNERIQTVQNTDRINDWKTQFSVISAIPEVEAVSVTDVGVEVMTSNLISDPFEDGKRRVFGKFRISLMWNGAVHITCLNKAEVKDPQYAVVDRYYRYEHPHVYPEEDYPYPHGNVCWGNIETSVDEFVGQAMFDAGVALVLQFLVTFNEQAVGHYSVASWWEATDEVLDRIDPARARNRAGGGQVIVEDGQVVAQTAAAVAVEEDDHTRNPRARTRRVWQWEVQPCPAVGRVVGLPDLTEDQRHTVCPECGREILVTHRRAIRAHGNRRQVMAEVPA